MSGSGTQDGEVHQRCLGRVGTKKSEKGDGEKDAPFARNPTKRNREDENTTPEEKAGVGGGSRGKTGRRGRSRERRSAVHGPQKGRGASGDTRLIDRGVGT